jgi:serralysin
VTFSIPAAGAAWPGYAANGAPSDPSYGVLSSGEAAAFRDMMHAWGLAYAPGIVETLDATNPGEIRVAFSAASFSQGTPPADGAPAPADGDIWLPSFLTEAAFSPTDPGGQYDFILSRIGAALGLSYLSSTLLGSAFATTRYSVMAPQGLPDDLAWFVSDTPSGPAIGDYVVQPTTPMVLDDYALLKRFGEPVASPGNTTYTFSEGQPLMATIVDSGGVDTIDLSDHTRASLVDLTPGSYSSIDYFSAADQLAYWSAKYPSLAATLAVEFERGATYQWTQNLGIAFGTVIEDVNAGSGSDTIIGNFGDNTLHGGAGDDSITGGDGSNYLRGDDGNDVISGAGSGFDDINGNKGDDTISGGPGGDWLVGGQGNDSIISTAGNDILYGNIGNDTLSGGSDADVIRGGQGDDVLTGGAGNDWLSGDRGNDTLTGGAGADTFHTFSGAGMDVVTDFNAAQGDRVQVDAGTSYTVSQQGADTVIDMGGGNEMILKNVTLSSLPQSWIFTL